MIGFMRLIPFLCAATLMTQAPCFAEETKFENQCAIGNDLRIPVHHWYREGQDPKGIIVGIPGLVFNGRAYDVAARELVSRGFEVYTLDVRGYGDWKTAKGQFDGDELIHFGQTKEDLTKVLQVLRQKNIGKSIFCLGESFGAAYAVWAASDTPHLIDGVVAVGLPYRVCIHPRPRWLLTFAEGLRSPRKPMDLVPYLVPTLSNDKEVTLAALNDDSISMKELSATDLIKAKVTIRSATENVEKIPAEMPVLVIAGQNDAIQKTYRLPEVVSAMGSKHAHLVMLPNKGHLLIERKQVDPDAMGVINAWLDQQVEKQQIAQPQQVRKDLPAPLNSISSTAPTLPVAAVTE